MPCDFSEGILFIVFFFLSQSSKDQVVACEFNPHSEELQIVSCGKNHILFWKLDESGNLVKKQGLFEVNMAKFMCR